MDPGWTYSTFISYNIISKLRTGGGGGGSKILNILRTVLYGWPLTSFFFDDVAGSSSLDDLIYLFIYLFVCLFSS